jgi:predicted flavoprotein YhiN
LERTKEAGKKILMSGGSRCNVMPTDYDLNTDFFTDSPKGALRAVFASWGIWDCWSWLSDPAHIGLHLELEEESQKWFPASNSSKDVRNQLVAACMCAP